MSLKYGLALHTTTPELGIAISNFENDSRSRVWDLGRETSSYLHQYLLEFIQPQTWSDLSFIAVAKGPGGFTGTRIGVVTARTLAQQLNLPLLGISNLAAAAYEAIESGNTTVAVQMNARRGQLFVAIYRACRDRFLRLTPDLADTLMTPEVWQQTLHQLDTPYQLVDATDNLASTVTNVLQLAYLDWQQGKQTLWMEVMPFYGQHPV